MVAERSLYAAIAEARAAIPEQVDLSGYATRDDLEAVAASLTQCLDRAAADIGADIRAARIAAEQALAELPAEVERQIATVDVAGALQDGVSALRGHLAAEVEKAVAAIDRDALRGEPGRLPVVVPWADGVHYAAAVVTHRGATWQAQRDTGKEPGESDDWTCLAEPGGTPRGFTIRGTYDGDAAYNALDIVAMNGSSFVAKVDRAGACPGDDWQLWAQPGRPGKPGEAGRKGDRGDPGPAADIPAALTVDRSGLLTLTMTDGTALAADFYPVLSEIAAR
jgi:hypothetical protein